MAQVQDENKSKRIKLFGTTISIQNHIQTQTITDQVSIKSLSGSKTLDKITSDHDSTITDQGSIKSLSDGETLEKKPEKIVPCPRCKSMATKFCYFNNYNVNQPRHFCKGCHRYWTAGGALRDVPIGAGRRKNKPPCLSPDGFPESYFLEDLNGGQRVDFDAVVEEMCMVQGRFGHVFPGKRRLSISGGHSC